MRQMLLGGVDGGTVCQAVHTYAWCLVNGLIALQLACPGMAQDAAANLKPQWQRYIVPNPAYLRAQQHPAFRMTDPVGLVTSAERKAAERRAAARLRDTLARAKAEGVGKLRIPPGEYRFAGNRGLVLEGYTNVTILADGVTFWFERPIEQLAADPKGLRLRLCRNVKIKGLKIDFDPPVYLQARIVAIDEAAPSFEIEIDPDFPAAEMNGGAYFLYRADGRWIQHGYLFYERTRHIEGRRYRVLLRDGRVFQTHNHDPFVLAYTRGHSRIGPGDYMALPFRRGRAVHVDRCQNCTFEDVDIYASPGMGVLERQGPGGNTYRRLRIIRRPGTRRLHVCAADGFHNAQTDRGPQLLECEITGTSDDFFNLHGHFGVVWQALGEREFIIGQANLGELQPGALLTFYHHITVETLGRAHIVSLRKLTDPKLIAACDAVQLARHANRNYYRVELDRALPLVPGTLVALERFRSAGFLIKDCYFHDAMARSLINGAGDGAIEHNVIERAAWPLVVHFETWQYYEGPPPRNIRIERNVIRKLGDPIPEGGIRVTMVPQDGGWLRPTQPLRNIRIIGNYIEDPGAFAIMMTNVRGGEVRDNILVRPMGCADYKPGGLSIIQSNIGHRNYFKGRARRAAISLWSCRDVRVEGNRLLDPEGRCADGLVQRAEAAPQAQ